MNAIGQLFGTLFSPFTSAFHALFQQPIFNVLMLIYRFISGTGVYGSFAISVVIVTLLIRSCLIPLTRKQLQSSRAMQVLQPKLKELQAQYRNDPQGLMAAQQALYKEHGVSPLSGCLPLIVQMPFLYAMYYAFITVLGSQPHESNLHHLARINSEIYNFLPKLSALPHSAFFWADLSRPDPWHILPIVAALLTLIQLRMSMPVRKKNPGQTQDPTAQATQTTMYIMPLFTLFFGWNFAAGLALYWCVTTTFSAVQTYFLTGLGSLFVGIPGFEHLVPEPKETPALATSASPRTLPSARATATPSASEEPAPRRGIMATFRDALAAAQEQSRPQPAAQALTAGGGVASPSAEAKPFTVSKATADERAARERRLRATRDGGVVLVKPPTNRADTTSAPSTTTANSGNNGNAAPAPKAPSTTTANSGNNGNAANGPAKSTSAPTVPGAARAAGQSAGGQRTPGASATNNNGNGPRKASASSRGRSGRPKGR